HRWLPLLPKTKSAAAKSLRKQSPQDCCPDHLRLTVTSRKSILPGHHHHDETNDRCNSERAKQIILEDTHEKNKISCKSHDASVKSQSLKVVRAQKLLGAQYS